MGKIVYSYYCLDILHFGHILQIKNAKRLAGPDGISIIGILTDKAVMEKKSKPIMSFDERILIAESIRYADVIIPQETYSPVQNILKIKPDILIESMSHSVELINESEKAIKSVGGIVVITPYYPNRSSSNIKKFIIMGTK